MVLKNTLPETNSSTLKIGIPNRKVVFQPSIFRGYVSFREGTWLVVEPTPLKYVFVKKIDPFP